MRKIWTEYQTRFARLTSGDVEIEEIAVEYRLNDARNDGNPVEVTLHIVTIDPIENIEESVDAQCK